MNQPTVIPALDHQPLLESLVATDNLLIIQDLDGVCMGLVRDPLSRTIDRAYVEATRRLAGHFYVLTNGEHIGSRGVNAIVERAFALPEHPAEQGFYLPGLAAGGVQLQDRFGRVSHPGVSDAELEFLRAVPDKARHFLEQLLATPPFALPPPVISPLVAATVLDNLVSPTLNLNELHRHLAGQPSLYGQLQQAGEGFLRRLLREAGDAQLGASFFIHLAPNLGRDARGEERMRLAEGDHAGTTDFQFMLKGAIKEVGVLVILNHYVHQRTGRYPLGEHFNARQAPHDLDALLALARAAFDPEDLPRIVGVGDTVTSSTEHSDGKPRQLRGGSDRGFLTLVQRLGEVFGTDNQVLYIDSSGGEVRRPGVDAAHLRRCGADRTLSPWPALAGISDPADPLRLDAVFCGGFQEYLAFFQALAARRGS